MNFAKSDALEQIETGLYEQALAAGRSAEESRASAQLLASHYMVMTQALAQKYPDMTPLQVMEKMGVHIQGEGPVEGSGEVYDQAVRSGLNMEEKVPVVDLSSVIKGAKKTDLKGLVAHLRGLLGQESSISRDALAILSVPSRSDKIKHIAHSGADVSKKHKATRNASVLSLPELMKNAIYVDKEPNSKQSSKPNVLNYIRFYVPVLTNGKLSTVRIVAEEKKDSDGITPVDVDVYDVIVEKKSPSPSPENKGSRQGNSFSEITIGEMLKGVKGQDGNVYAQTAWHGSPYQFESFDLGAVGSGEGSRVHGRGLYFAQDKAVSQRYKDRLSTKAGLEGSLTEVDIPNNDVLLDEDKALSEQPPKVQAAIMEYFKSRPDSYIVADDLPGVLQTGEQFYKDVVFQMRKEGHERASRAASELLNSFGIKGITYDGERDGRSFVVFDDKAIQVIERYNQAQKNQWDTDHQGLHWKKRLDLDSKNWRKLVDDFMSGAMDSRNPVPVMDMPQALQLAGAPDRKIVATFRLFNHTIAGKHANDISPDLMKQLPRALADPIMVLDSDTLPGESLVVVLDLKDKNGATVVVPLRLSVAPKDAKAPAGLTSFYGKVKDATGKPKLQWFVDQSSKNLLYLNTKKAARWSTESGLQLPTTVNLVAASGKTIPTEDDLVKGKRQNPLRYQGEGASGGQRGSIRFGSDGQAAITLFQNADSSTLIHETGHLFFDHLMLLSRELGGNWSDMERTVLSWMKANASEEWGVKPWAELSGDQKREAHELFARGFESWVREGKAPSKELRSAFAAFAKWLVQMYRTVYGTEL